MNIQQFYLKATKPNERECMIWLGAKDKKGYGMAAIPGYKSTRAHRLAYELENGEIPKGMFICHSCDQPSCININHLWMGTPKENSQDMMNKNRGNLKKGMRFEFAPSRPYAKLKEEDVRIIRKRIINGETMVAIAKDYNISDRTVNDINSGKLWSSIDTENDRLLREKATRLTKSRVRTKRLTKLAMTQIKEIKIRLQNGEGQKKIGIDYNVSQFCIYEIKHERRWKHI